MAVKGTIFNIQKYSIHDGPGIRTIIFLKGCPLRCQWCSNPESGEHGIQIVFNRNLCVQCGACLQVCGQGAIRSDARFGKIIDHSQCIRCGACIANCPTRALKKIGRSVQVQEVVREVLKDLIFYRKSGGGATLSGGEPFAQPQFTCALLQELKGKRISTAVETTGAVPFSAIEPSLENIDLFLYDLKCMDSAKHEQYTLVPNERILENLREINRRGKRIWVRVPLISGINDNLENIRCVFEIAQELEHVERVELLPYHEYGVGKYAQLGLEYKLEGMKPPEEAQIDALLQLAADQFPGLQVIVRRHG